MSEGAELRVPGIAKPCGVCSRFPDDPKECASVDLTPPDTAATDPLVWQGHGGTKYHREDCSLMSHGAVSWRRSFAAADAANGLGLEPCKACRPEVDAARPSHKPRP